MTIGIDVWTEKHIDDYWNMGGERELSDAWTGFTRFVLLNEGPHDGFSWSGERLTRKQTTSRPDNVWPDMWQHMSDASKRRAKQKRIIEKPKFDNVRRIRGIFIIDPDDEEFKRTMKKRSLKSWKFRCQHQCFVKHQKNSRWETSRIIGKHKTKYACIKESILLICVSQDSHQTKSILQGHVAPHKKRSGKKRVHREELFKSVNLKNAIRVRQNSRKGHKAKPCTKKDAPAE